MGLGEKNIEFSTSETNGDQIVEAFEAACELRLGQL